jgi:4-diphosphocytidyl-2-C-methyl-D-erythritol kinase
MYTEVHNDRRSEQQRRQEGKRQVKAYAKINLSLDVTARLPDGYHSIRTIMQQVGLYDVVEIEILSRMEGSSEKSPSVVVELSGKEEYLKEIPSDGENIALKAAKLFFSKIKCGSLERVNIKIEKRIPPSAGLAGGSADAAAVLLGLGSLINELSRRTYLKKQKDHNFGESGSEGGISPEPDAFKDGTSYLFRQMLELGSVLGADVPFCIMGQTYLNPTLGFKFLTPLAHNDPNKAIADIADSGAIPTAGVRPSISISNGHRTSDNEALPTVGVCALGEGRGDILRPATPLSGWVLLVKPPLASSTALVYGRLNIKDIVERPDTDELVSALKVNNYALILKNMINTLEIAALKVYPEIADLKRKMVKWADADKVLMSGSGSTVFALYKDEGACRRGAGILASRLTDCDIFPVALISHRE